MHITVRKLVIIASLSFFISCSTDVNTYHNFSNIDPEWVGINKHFLGIIDNFILQAIEKKEVIGTSAIIVKDGGIAYHKAFGLADVENTIKMETNTIVAIASMSKLMTTAGALILFDKGLYSMDTRLDKILPEFSNPSIFLSYDENSQSFNTKEATQPILMRHLFSHTSGIVYPIFIPDSLGRKGYLSAAVQDAFPDMTISLEDNIKRLATLPLISNPGEKWWYGMNMDVLGRVIEVLDGRPFAKFMEEEIFIPLQLENTGFSLPRDKWENVAKIYQYLSGKPVEFKCCPQFSDVELKQIGRERGPVEFFKNDTDIIAMGGADIFSTAYDYAKFLQMLLNGGTFDGVQILSRKTVEMINRPLEDLFRPDDPGIAMGLSVGVVKDENMNYEHHSTGSYWWGGYFYTSYWVDPKEKLIGVIMNQVHPANSDLNKKFQQLVYSSLN